MRGIYIVAGYPDRERFKECFESVVRNGFEFIEIGIPFNDPIDDGPVIAQAIHDSLEKGILVDQIIEDIIAFDGKPIKKYIMTYANIIYSYGIKKFSDTLSGHVSGIIIPDLPNRMARFFYDKGFAIPIVPFATLETRESDIKGMNASDSEFIYFVGLRGITGAVADYSAPEFLHAIDMIKKNTTKKVIVGFGIKTREDADNAIRISNGYVVGTEAVRRQNDPAAFDAYLKGLSI